MNFNNLSVRSGCKDIWNAFMAEGVKFCKHDIPFCPTTATTIPADIITWEEAKSIHKKIIAMKDYDYRYDAFVCFYMDDYKFDGPKGVWLNPEHALEVLKHFAGAITVDFSTYLDFPEPIKTYATYRMRLLGYWWGKNGIAVINNVRWGTYETYDYCFEGIPTDSLVTIGTVGGGPRRLVDRERFVSGLSEMIKRLRPHTILVYGSANHECFDQLKIQGIKVIQYPSKTYRDFERRKADE
ncbi:MAG: DUF4417 domain-containing protein [Clostridiales bacterium]|nr:DUF4417 domain-containing protein [Clostridiales bacterium]